MRQLGSWSARHVNVLSKALKAGSTLPWLATKTALTTLGSVSGKASIRVASVCAMGLMGRGGFGGGVSSSLLAGSWKLTFLGCGEVVEGAAAAGVGASSSEAKSMSCFVVMLSYIYQLRVDPFAM